MHAGVWLMTRVTEPNALIDIAATLSAGERLREVDARALTASHDLLTLGMLAADARRRRHGDRITFVRVAVVGLEDAPLELDDRAMAAAGEIRVVGVPLDLAAARDRVAAVASAAGGIPLSAFSLADLAALATEAGRPLADVLTQLEEAGLELVAEAPIDRLEDPVTSFRAVQQAGLRVARVTLDQPFGVDQREGIRRVVELQAAVGNVRAFAPLARRVEHSTGYDDVKQVALARLLVDNIESIQVDWALHGPKLAQVALSFGADDVDAVSPVDRPELGRRRTSLEEIRHNIRSASLVPLERNGRFETERQ